MLKRWGASGALGSAMTVAIVAVAGAADLGQQSTAFEVAHTSPARHGVSGVVGIYGGWDRWHYLFGSPTFTGDGSVGVAGGDVRANLWLSPDTSAQADIEGEATTRGFPANANVSTGFGRSLISGGLHLSVRDPGSFLFGAFGGAVWSNQTAGYASVANWFAGLEGQAYFDRATLYGQVGYSDALDHELPVIGMQSWFIRGVGRYFLTPNDKVQVEAGLQTGNFTGDCCSRHRVWNWGALYEHKFDGPVSAFVEYAGFVMDNLDFVYTNTEHQIMVGVRLNLNQDTLLAADRNGATLDLPKLGRPYLWAGWTR